VTVSLNSSGTGVQGSGVSTLSPAPPISNCLGKLVVLTVAFRDTGPTVSSISGATYYYCGGGTTRLRIYCKNGEAVEPTPTVNIGSPSGREVAQINVYNITGGLFPTIAADGDGVLSTQNLDLPSSAGMTYSENNVPVGGGFYVQYGLRLEAGPWGFGGITKTSGWVDGGNYDYSGTTGMLIAAQIRTAKSTTSSIARITETITGDVPNDVLSAVTVEFSFGVNPVGENIVQPQRVLFRR